jgi:hypothetical protein
MSSFPRSQLWLLFVLTRPAVFTFESLTSFPSWGGQTSGSPSSLLSARVGGPPKDISITCDACCSLPLSLFSFKTPFSVSVSPHLRKCCTGSSLLIFGSLDCGSVSISWGLVMQPPPLSMSTSVPDPQVIDLGFSE